MPVGDTLEVRFFSSWGDQAGVNVRHFRIVTVTGTELTHFQIASQLSTRFHNLFKALMHTSAEFRGVGVKRISPGAPTAEATNALDRGPGTRTGDPLPPQISGLLSLRTALAGPRNRGRMYLPFPGETDSTSAGRPSATYVAALSAVADNLVPAFNLIVGLQIVELQSVIRRRTPFVITDVTNILTRDRWATQRRRGDFGAQNVLPV